MNPQQIKEDGAVEMIQNVYVPSDAELPDLREGWKCLY